MENIKIVIVGAGMAGISAAERLISAGYTSVTVLEGMDRVGGRIDTRPHGDGGIIEMGAQWIHGEERNPVFELARRHDLVDLAALADPDTDEELEFYLSSGRFITRSVIRETFMVLDNIFNEATRFSKECGAAPETTSDQTMGTYVRNAFYAYLRASPDPDDVKRMKDGLFNWRMTMEKTENGCASVHDMSLCAWGEYVLCAGQEAVELSHGYRPVLDVILAKIPEECFRLNTRVKEILWDEVSEEEADIKLGKVSKFSKTNAEALETIRPASSRGEAGKIWEKGMKMDERAALNCFNGNEICAIDDEVDSQSSDQEMNHEDLKNANVESKIAAIPVIDACDSKVVSDLKMASDSRMASNSKMADAQKCRVVTTTGETFDVDHVIVTCSLGCLKACAAEMFRPPLPESKLSAIRRLGFGTVNKIYLEFERPFWSDQCGGIQLAWLPNDDLTLKCLKDRDEDEYRGEWYKGIHGFDVVALHSNLLCGWIAGTEAQTMETLSDDLVLSVCHELLQTFTGNPDSVDRPTRIIRTNWFANDCTLGSYSYRHMGSSVADSLELGRALPGEAEPRLQFAGEATHATFFSTTHGAMLTGQREADRIIEYHGGRSGRSIAQ